MNKIVLLGMMSRHPVAGVIWQTLHYLLGFERLGYEVYYVEAAGHQPSAMLGDADDRYRSVAAAAFIRAVMHRFDLDHRWAFHALHHDGRCYGMSEPELVQLYGSADLIVNLHGCTIPRAEHSRTGRLVFLETDPVALQIELAESLPHTIAYLEPHVAFFTFGENIGQPGCRIPTTERFQFRPTRQPVVGDLWDTPAAGGSTFTTLGNWAQGWRDIVFNGEVYHWSKHHEFLKFLDVPRRTGQRFELALSRCDTESRVLLEAHGWAVRDALTLSTDLDAYRSYIQASRGEYTVAKDQNVRLRSGWFSDRSATYLAAGKPVITQDTGFGDHLPTGQGLFAFSSLDDINQAVAAINDDYDRHCRAARAIAHDYFGHEAVLGKLLAELGMRPTFAASYRAVAG
jgi:hypothetical protein